MLLYVAAENYSTRQRKRRADTSAIVYIKTILKSVLSRVQDRVTVPSYIALLPQPGYNKGNASGVWMQPAHQDNGPVQRVGYSADVVDSGCSPASQ